MDWLLASAIATAVFTGAIAGLTLLQMRGQIIVDDAAAFAGDHIELDVIIRNYTKRALRPWRFEVTKLPVRQVGSAKYRQPGWPVNATPLGLVIEPGMSGHFLVAVTPDWTAEPWVALAKKKRPGSLLISIKIDSNARVRRTKIRQFTSKIHADIIIKHALVPGASSSATI